MPEHHFTPPPDIAEILQRHGWPVDPTFDEVEMAGMILGKSVSCWADRIVTMVNETMPGTSGVAYLDDEHHLVGIGLVSGLVAGAQTEYAVTDVAREDACFTLRAFSQGYARVRPMPLLPVAMIDVLTGKGLDGSKLGLGITAAGDPDVPDGARVFVEVDPAQRDVVYDVWAVAPSTASDGLGVWRVLKAARNGRVEIQEITDQDELMVFLAERGYRDLLKRCLSATVAA